MTPKGEAADTGNGWERRQPRVIGTVSIPVLDRE
jgi:hypothetical protein